MTGGYDRGDVREEKCNLLEIHVMLTESEDWDEAFVGLLIQHRLFADLQA